MKHEAFATLLHQGMEPVQLSPQLRRATLNRMAGKEQPVMKKKLSVALVCAIVLTMLWLFYCQYILMAGAGLCAIKRKPSPVGTAS